MIAASVDLAGCTGLLFAQSSWSQQVVKARVAPENEGSTPPLVSDLVQLTNLDGILTTEVYTAIHFGCLGWSAQTNAEIQGL